MTTSEVLSPPPPSQVASLAQPQFNVEALQAFSMPLVADVVNTENGDVASFARSSWHKESGKAGAVSFQSLTIAEFPGCRLPSALGQRPARLYLCGTHLVVWGTGSGDRPSVCHQPIRPSWPLLSAARDLASFPNPILSACARSSACRPCWI